MKTVNYNQFQGLYELTDKRKVIVDFLHNNIKLYDDDTEFSYSYDDEYSKESARLDSILCKKPNESLDITIITSLECNMECRYCYEKSGGLNIRDKHRIINTSYILNFITSELNNSSLKKLNINVLGGEPLLENNIKFLDELLYGVRRMNINTSLSLVTNGINISEYINNILLWGISSIQITLDGIESIHNKRRITVDKKINGFKKVEEGINMLLQHKIKVFLRVNVDEYNIDEIVDFAKYIKENGWTDKGLIPYIYPLTSSGSKAYTLNESETSIFRILLDKFKDEEENIKELFKFDFHGIDYIDSLLEEKLAIIRTRFCGVSKGHFVVFSDGTILNCWWGIEEDIFKIGKIENMNYHLDHTKMKKFRQRNTIEIQRCKLCKFKYICGAGCTFKEYLNNGTISNGNCNQFDKLIKEYLDFAL